MTRDDSYALFVTYSLIDTSSQTLCYDECLVVGSLFLSLNS